MFALQPELMRAVRDFHRERLGKIVSANMPVPMEHCDDLILVHILPASAFVPGGLKVSTAELADPPDAFRPFDAWGMNWHVNFNGTLTTSNRGEKPRCYSQAYRDGRTESVTVGIVREQETAQGVRRYLFQEYIETRLVQLVRLHLKRLSELGFVPPFIVSCSLAGVRNCQIDADQRLFDPLLIADNILVFDDVLVEEFPGDVPSTALVLKPIFDQLANAGGRIRSRHFGENDNWLLQIPS